MSLLRSPGQTTNGTGEHDITKRLSSSSASTIVYTPGTQLMEPAYRLRSGSVYYPSRHHETQHLDRLIRSSSFFLTVLAILQRTPLSSKKCQIPGVPMISHLLCNLIHSSSTLSHSPVRTTFPLPPPGGEPSNPFPWSVVLFSCNSSNSGAIRHFVTSNRSQDLSSNLASFGSNGCCRLETFGVVQPRFIGSDGCQMILYHD